MWDEATPQLDALWKTIPAETFAETMTAFGQYTAPLYDLILYVIDNEIHHRGQGYVYLRALGIEPPPFHDRSQLDAVEGAPVDSPPAHIMSWRPVGLAHASGRDLSRARAGRFVAARA
ncbi:MAG TPA: DinB family protein [Vicinamibacterales bacterium]|nr:DinB family protein [Vicinamibacterales bacterium]